jgi:glycosyltransferase involved in cell wall biosynthesis
VRIVFLNPSGELGGAETALLEMLAALREARPSWTLSLVASASGPLIDRVATLGVPSTALPFPPSVADLGEWGRRGSRAGRLRLGAAVAAAAPHVLAYASQLRRHLKRAKPDVLHTNGLKMHLLGARCRPRGTKLVWHLHDYPAARPISAKLLRMHLSRCDGVLANSASVAAEARSLFGNVPIHTLHNAVDLDRFRPDGARLDLDALSALPPLADNGVRIGLVGTFARWKGHSVFLTALSRLRPAVPVRGYVIGEPIYETAGSQFSMAELRAMAASHGLADSVGFTGRVEDVPGALRALDIVVHASVEPEPFGLVIAEAMACGRAVIVSRAGGAVEIAEAGAVFHQPGNSDELAQRLGELVANRSRRSALGTAGRAAAERLFNRKRLADTLVPIYESLA